VFIFGAGRSGTTLLQRLLNSYPDTLIWGEHAGVLEQLADGFFRGVEDPNLFRHALPLEQVLTGTDARESWQAWMTWFSADRWTAAFRTMVDTLFRPGGLRGKTYWGFKDIRYGERPRDRTLDLLHALFPEAVFVFIVRDPRNVIASRRRMWGGLRSFAALRDAAALWESRYRSYMAWHRDATVESFWIRYEDLIEQQGEILTLLGYMGRELGEEQRAVLASSGGRGSAFRDDAVNERWRRLPSLWRAYLRARLGTLMDELGYPASAASGAERWLGPFGRVLAAVERMAGGRRGVAADQSPLVTDAMAPGGSATASSAVPRSRAAARLREKRATVRQ
jgi:hypothetical protein